MSSKIFTQLEELIKNSTVDPAKATPSDVLADIGCPTTSIAILEDGEISSHCISTGSDNVDTLIQACSISKAVAGLAIMRLIELGHLSLEDKAVNLLPADIVTLMAKDTRTESLLKLVTVKQLMSHTSGLSIGGFPGYPDLDKVPTMHEILEGRLSANTQPIKMLTLPGLEFMYSGGGITVLQCAVEHVMKTPFAQIMEKYVFKPLDMSRSCYHFPTDETNVAASYYHGHYPNKVRWHTLPELAAAGLWTTPTDLLKVVRAIQDSLEGKKHDTFLKKDTVELMLRVVKDPFALTWAVNQFSFFHSGSNFPGYHTFVAGFADLPWNKKKDDSKSTQETGPIPAGCGIAIMTNAAQGNIVLSKVLAAIAYSKGWPEPSYKWFGDADPGAPFPVSHGLPEPGEWTEWVGDEWSGGWTIAQDTNGIPLAGIESAALVRLFPAAIPPLKYAGGKQSTDLVMGGIEILLRLGWDGEERIVELHNCGSGRVTVLRRSKKTGA